MVAREGGATARNIVFLLAAAILVLLAYLGGQKAYEDYATGGIGYVRAVDQRFDDAMDRRARKMAFFAFLRPVVMAENRRIEGLRRNLIAMRTAGLTAAWVRAAAKDYGIAWTGAGTGAEWKALLQRVDTMPLLLALAQSAIETNWGQSRFARQGNNMFGQWCFKAGCGLVPGKRASGKKHEVAAYDTVNASVRAYLKNINTGAAYRGLRDIRLQARSQGKEPSAIILATGLARYSEQGSAYVDKIQAMIQNNRSLMLDASL